MSNSEYLATLGQLNLNLLPALDALLREGSVTAAARRAGVSQSAMSHSLAKLRVLLADPLLIASGRAMAITPRGEQLAKALPSALAALEAALAPPVKFDPKTAERRLRIATFDYFEFTTLPEVLAYLRRHAPGIGIDIERLDSRSIERLVNGELDFVFAGESMRMPSTVMQRLLYRDPFVVMARPGHPRLQKRLTLDRYVELDHAMVSVEGRAHGLVDRILEEHGRSRRVALRLPHFGCAPLAVMHSDMVCTIASTVAYRAKEVYGVRVVPVPLALPSIGALGWWPRQHHEDPARRWFRDILFSGKALSRRIRKLMRAIH